MLIELGQHALRRRANRTDVQMKIDGLKHWRDAAQDRLDAAMSRGADDDELRPLRHRAGLYARQMKDLEAIRNIARELAGSPECLT
jgi:CobQ-like glutamine amidotransferase family enzyme